ncbi:MAG TPA: hypothetical protein VM888_13985 [Chitinophagaceae bacterium]|jgi:hypothetical protein|nr:hypothetical protein [Chitinophagaceae bacterium]
MKRGLKEMVVLCSFILVTVTVVACNDMNSEKNSTTEKTNVSDTRRNNPDTSNYLVDSTGKNDH